MNAKLLYVTCFDSEFKGNSFKLYQFFDKYTLQIFYGTNIKGDLKELKEYDCTLVANGKKLKVVACKPLD